MQWSPKGDYFVTVAGFMPAKSTIFTAACKPHYDLGSGPHNMARWNPQARPLSGRAGCAGAARLNAPAPELRSAQHTGEGCLCCRASGPAGHSARRKAVGAIAYDVMLCGVSGSSSGTLHLSASL